MGSTSIVRNACGFMLDWHTYKEKAAAGGLPTAANMRHRAMALMGRGGALPGRSYTWPV